MEVETHNNPPKLRAKELIGSIRSSSISIQDINELGKKAESIDKTFGGDNKSKELFWKSVLHAVKYIEKQEGKNVHKGFIYFRIATRQILQGRLDNASVKWLARAIQEDKILYGSKWQIQSAYRLYCILKLFQHFIKNIRNQNTKSIIDNAIMNSKENIGTYLCRLYDITLSGPPIFRTLTYAPFFRLIKSNRRRVYCRECYDGARYLIERKERLIKTNLQKYGVAMATIVLCGTTLEGILLSQNIVRKIIRRNAKSSPRYTLDQGVIAMFSRIKNNPELIASLFILWFSRNLIHPEVRVRYRAVIDMEYADYVWEITNYVIQELNKVI